MHHLFDFSDQRKTERSDEDSGDQVAEDRAEPQLFCDRNGNRSSGQKNKQLEKEMLHD